MNNQDSDRATMTRPTERQTPAPPGDYGPKRLRATVTLVVLLLAAGLVWVFEPKMVDALARIQKAGAAQTTPIPGNVHTYTLTQVTTWSTGQGQSRTETQWWYQAPNRVRIETTNTGPGLTSKVQRITVNDGVDTWYYDSAVKTVQSHRSEPGQPVGPIVSDKKGGNLTSATLDGLLRLESTCYSPSLRGTDSVAGRPAYVLDLGPTKCPSNAAPEMNGRLVIWVDKETFFLLKSESYSPTDDSSVVGSLETTSIHYNIPIDAARFTLTAPND